MTIFSPYIRGGSIGDFACECWYVLNWTINDDKSQSTVYVVSYGLSISEEELKFYCLLTHCQSQRDMDQDQVTVPGVSLHRLLFGSRVLCYAKNM